MASRDPERRTVSIRWSLIRNLSLLLVLLTGLVLLATVLTGREIERFVSSALLQRGLDAAESELLRFFDPVQQGLEVARRMVGDGSLDLDDPEALDRHFAPLLASVPRISGVNVGDARGRSYVLMHVPSEGLWRSRVTRVDEWGPRLEYAEWRDAGGPVRRWVVEKPGPDEAYDPRKRAWYRVALEAAARAEPGPGLPGGVYWTEPYTFFSTGQPGITAMLQAEEPGGRRRVLAFDVLLSDISDFTRDLVVSEHGYGAVLAADGRMLGLPGLPRFDEEAQRAAALLRRPSESGVPTLEDAALAYARQLPDTPPTFPFRSGGERFWAGLRPVTLGRNASENVVILVPSRDLVGPVLRLRVLLVGASLLGFAGALVMSLVLARRYSRPLVRLAANSERIGALDLGQLDSVHSSLREVDQLAGEQERMRVALDSFSRYVPVGVVRELMSRGEAARIGGTRCDVTALFTDIRGFTSIAEGMEPEALTAHLAEYFEELLGIVQGDGFGTVTQVNGDGVVGFWGAPRPDPAHAAHAAAAVLACQERLAKLNGRWARAGRPQLFTRFGLASGAAVVGNVGAASRLVYTAIGDTVNLASRLEGLGRFYGTSALASAATREAAGDAFEWRLVDHVRVKGRSEAVGIHELLGSAGGVAEARLARARRYEQCLRLYRERRFAEARALLEALAAEIAGDVCVTRLLGLARGFELDPPAAGWEGVSEYFEK